MKKKSKRQKLMDDLDKACSEYVRKRDNKCILCGAHKDDYKSLQSHHWIVPRARSLKYKFDPRNCVSLCYGCHILKIHNQPTVALIDELKEKAMLAGVCTREEVEEIKEGSYEIVKFGIGELEYMLDELREKIKKLDS